MLILFCVVLKLIPGPNSYPDNEKEFFDALTRPGALISQAQRKKVLVYFVGGVTFSEIAALRFLNKKPDSKVTFLIATT